MSAPIYRPRFCTVYLAKILLQPLADKRTTEIENIIGTDIGRCSLDTAQHLIYIERPRCLTRSSIARCIIG